MAHTSTGMNPKTGKYHPDATKHHLSKSNKGFSETAQGKALKKKTGAKNPHSWLDKHVKEQARRHGPVISKLIKDVSR